MHLHVSLLKSNTLLLELETDRIANVLGVRSKNTSLGQSGVTLKDETGSDSAWHTDKLSH